MSLIEYAQRKGNQIIPRTLSYKYTYLFILLFFSYTYFGLYMPEVEISAIIEEIPSMETEGLTILSP
jgi:mannose/fructose/N-acetylgalactosamine-specific phosphotransferase system component IIC